MPNSKVSKRDSAYLHEFSPACPDKSRLKRKTSRTLLNICLLFISLTALLCSLTSCSHRTYYKYKIGVSQCVGGRWRDKVNNEMLSAQHLYDTDVKVCITNADNNKNKCFTSKNIEL